jgi:hypothetical protein
MKSTETMYKTFLTESKNGKWTIQINFNGVGSKRTIWINSGNFRSSSIMLPGFDAISGSSFSLSNLQARKEDFQKYGKTLSEAFTAAAGMSTKRKAESSIREMLASAVGDIDEIKITPYKEKEELKKPLWKIKIIVGKISTNRFSTGRNGLGNFKTIHISDNALMMIGGDDVSRGSSFSLSNLQIKRQNIKSNLNSDLKSLIFMKNKRDIEKEINRLFAGAVYHVDSISITKN